MLDDNIDNYHKISFVKALIVAHLKELNIN